MNRLTRDVAIPFGGGLSLFAIFVGAGLTYQTLLGSGSAERLVTVMLLDAIIVVGIQIYVGNTGILSFGHLGFGAIAGYTFAILAIDTEQKLKRLPDAPFGLVDFSPGAGVAMVVAILVALAVAVLVGFGLARSGAESGSVAATIITLALLFVVHEVARNWPELTGGARVGLTFSIGKTLDSRVPIYVALLATIVLARLYARSRFGRLAITAREDDLASRAIGVNPLVQQTVALMLSVVVVSVGVSLRVWDDGTILPDTFFFDYSLLTLVMLIVGGRNSVTGALAGVAVMTAVREGTRRLGQDGFEFFGLGLDGALDVIFRENLQSIMLGLAMVGFMIFRPKGLFDDWELDNWFSNKIQRRTEVEPEPLPELENAPQSHLMAKGLSVSFGGFQALRDAGLNVEAGEVVGIIGPNGAGKTTLVNVITGLVEPTGGSFSLDDVDVTDHPAHKLARAGIVRTFQNLRLFGAMTVMENVEAAALVAQRHRADRELRDPGALVAEAGLWEHRHRRASELDYGNSRRLELARAAAMSPTFMLLDEPTSGMSDSESLAMVERVRHMAATVGAGVLVIDHDLGFITGISDRIYALDQGAVIAQGTPEEVQANAVVRAAYLGVDA